MIAGWNLRGGGAMAKKITDIVHYYAPGAKGNLCNGESRGLITGWISKVTCGDCMAAALALQSAMSAKEEKRHAKGS